MDAEQTWPTQQELDEAEKQQKIVKRVPKGTSEYQAAWIPDEDGEELQDDEESEEGEGMEDVMEEENSDEEKDVDDKEEYETITVSECPNEHKYDELMDHHEERQAMVRFKGKNFSFFINISIKALFKISKFFSLIHLKEM